jgi:hypothetical protein
MTPKNWIDNLNNSIELIPNKKIVEIVFSSIIDLTLKIDWKGACHESCGAIHILLNESGINNSWCIGEVKFGNIYFDHSWIEINDEIYDISICNTLLPDVISGPVIRGLDIENNKPTTALYSVISGAEEDETTRWVKQNDLSSYLLNSPMHPILGTWIIVEQIAKHKLNINLNIPSLIKKYKGFFYTQKP